MNKMIREIMTKFDNIEILEQAQLLSLFLKEVARDIEIVRCRHDIKEKKIL